MSEAERVRNIMQDVADGRESTRKLKYDPATRSMKAASAYDDPDFVKPMTHQDMNLYGGDREKSESDKRITISSETLQEIIRQPGSHEVVFSAMDHATVFTLLRSADSGNAVPGTVQGVDDIERVDIATEAPTFATVRVFVEVNGWTDNPVKSSINSGQHWPAKGYVFQHGGWQEAKVQIVPVREQLFSRFTGLLETEVLSEKRVLIIGLGSGGSAIAVGLAQSGIMNFDMVDHDRLEVGNVARHAAGISDVGRLKVEVMKDLIRQKNPYALVEGFGEKVCWDTSESLRERVKKADLVICATDDRTSKKIVNRLCVQEKKVLIVAGAFRRAYGGQALRVRPGESLCFQCFLNSLPEQARDTEITSTEQAEGLAYTDKPVPIEPGLSSDIAPINQMVVKLALQELLRATETTLQSLDEDLVAPLYLWLNRRQQDTCYEDLEPLEFNVDGMRILRWYGVDISPDPACPECGDFLGQMQAQHGVTVNEEDVKAFN